MDIEKNTLERNPMTLTNWMISIDDINVIDDILEGMDLNPDGDHTLNMREDRYRPPLVGSERDNLTDFSVV